MSTLTIYSSAPASVPLAVALLGISHLGVEVVLKPISAMPPARAPRRRCASLRAEALTIGEELRALGERLDDHTAGRRRLAPGEREEAIAAQAALLARRRQIEQQLREGGQPV